MKYKCGSIVTEATGKLGGHVFMGKGNGGVLRSGIVSNSHVGSLVATRRSRYVTIIKAWRNLSTANKNLWLSYLSVYKSYSGNWLVNVKSDRELFMAVNLFASQIAATLISIPVMPIRYTVNGVFVVSAVLNTLVLNINYPSYITTRRTFIVYASRPVSVGVSRFDLPLRYLRSSGSGIPQNYNYYNVYRLAWGNIWVPRNKILIKIVEYDYLSGIKLDEKFYFTNVL